MHIIAIYGNFGVQIVQIVVSTSKLSDQVSPRIKKVYQKN